MNNILKKCFSPEELVKIGKISYNGPMAVLKESFHLDMTDMVRNLRQFDMDRGLSKEEKLSRAQQAAINQIQYGVATHGVPGAFNFEDDNDDFKTVTKNKKVGHRATNSVIGKTFAEDFSEVEVDSFVSSAYSVAVEKAWTMEEEANLELNSGR